MTRVYVNYLRRALRRLSIALAAMVLSGPVLADRTATIEAIGCGGVFEDYIYKWSGHPNRPFVTLKNSVLLPGNWQTISTSYSYIGCYGPAQRRRWYKAYWCVTEDTNCASNAGVELYIPAEPCA